jgi:hypothetical protein
MPCRLGASMQLLGGTPRAVRQVAFRSRGCNSLSLVLKRRHSLALALQHASTHIAVSLGVDCGALLSAVWVLGGCWVGVGWVLRE